MITKMNGWSFTDKESMAYFKELGNYTFKFISWDDAEKLIADYIGEN